MAAQLNVPKSTRTQVQEALTNRRKPGAKPRTPAEVDATLDLILARLADLEE